MEPFAHPIEELTQADLEALIRDGVSESRSLEYSEELPNLDQESGRIDLLREVTSFANSTGGWLVYGIKERRDDSSKATGIPGELAGIALTNPGKMESRIHQMLNSSIDPPIWNTTARAIEITDGRFALVLRILPGTSPPHMVLTGKGDRFFRRTGQIRQPMDITTIREAVMKTAGRSQVIAAWRQERLDLAHQHESVLPNLPSARLFLHILPSSALPPSEVHFPARRISGSWPEIAESRILFHMSYRRHLADGHAIYSLPSPPVLPRFALLGSSGFFEFCDTQLLEPKVSRDSTTPKKRIDIRLFEPQVVEVAGIGLSALRSLGVLPPLHFMLSLWSVHDYYFSGRYDEPIGTHPPINQTNVLLPHTTLHEFPDVENRQSVAASIRPTLDLLWNAFGCGSFATTKRRDARTGIS